MEIPPYPASRPLAMSDKPLLDRLCTDIQPRVSELTFAGLYLFRRAHEYRLATVADSIVVLGKGYDGSEYFLPPLGGDVAEALKVMFADGWSLYGADDPFIARYLCREYSTDHRDCVTPVTISTFVKSWQHCREAVFTKRKTGSTILPVVMTTPLPSFPTSI